MKSKQAKPLNRNSIAKIIARELRHGNKTKPREPGKDPAEREESWSKKKPEAAGYYWCRNLAVGRYPYIQEVIDTDRGLSLDDLCPLRLLGDHLEWSGPIPLPT